MKVVRRDTDGTRAERTRRMMTVSGWRRGGGCEEVSLCAVLRVDEVMRAIR